jgi:hypothetical protein
MAVQMCGPGSFLDKKPMYASDVFSSKNYCVFWHVRFTFVSEATRWKIFSLCLFIFCEYAFV